MLETKSIKHLACELRPREKAICNGVENLTDAELLAIILGSGIKGKNVLQVAGAILDNMGNFRRLAGASTAELKNIVGVGVTKATVIKACMEIARRFQQVLLMPGEVLDSCQKVFAHFHESLRAEKREKFYCVLLDCKNRVLKNELISVGSLNMAIVHPREVFVVAIRESANKVLLVHNHPSGDAEPSPEDINITQRLQKVGYLVGIEVVDHVIIGNGRYFSFLEQGLMKL
jgi:DNA repair protein RadC